MLLGAVSRLSVAVLLLVTCRGVSDHIEYILFEFRSKDFWRSQGSSLFLVSLYGASFHEFVDFRVLSEDIGDFFVRYFFYQHECLS